MITFFTCNTIRTPLGRTAGLFSKCLKNIIQGYNVVYSHSLKKKFNSGLSLKLPHPCFCFYEWQQHKYML